METLQGVRGACFLGLFACTVIICWVPLLSVAAVLLYFSIKDLQSKQYPECEIPLDMWAIVLASTVLALTLVQAVLYCLTSCKIATTPSSRSSRSGRGAGDDGARTPLQRQRSADPDEDKKGKGKLTTLIPCGQCCTLVVRDGASMSDGEEKLSCGFKVVTGIVAAFIFAWLIVGAMWVLPFREQHMTTHHCNPYLLGFSFYLLIAALIAIFAAMSCCCLLACASLTVGATVWAAVDGLVRKLFAWLGIDPAWANSFGIKMSGTPSEDSVKAAAAAGAVARTVVEKTTAQAAAAAGAASAGSEDAAAAAAADAAEKGAGTGIATAEVGGEAAAEAAATGTTAGGAGGSANSWYDTPGAAQRAVNVGTHFVHAFQEHVAPALAAAAAAQGGQQRGGAAGGSSGASTAAAVAASLATAAASTLAAAQAPAAAASSRPAPGGLRTASVRSKAFNHGADVPTGGAVHVDSGVVVGSTGIHPAMASGGGVTPSGGRPPVVLVADSEESEDDERRRLTATSDHAARQQALAGVHAVLVAAPSASAAHPARVEAVMVQKPADAADVDLVDALEEVITGTGNTGSGGGAPADDNSV